MSGKEELDREILIPPEIEDWANVTEMQYEDQMISRGWKTHGTCLRMEFL